MSHQHCAYQENDHLFQQFSGKKHRNSHHLRWSQNLWKCKCISRCTPASWKGTGRVEMFRHVLCSKVPFASTNMQYQTYDLRLGNLKATDPPVYRRLVLETWVIEQLSTCLHLHVCLHLLLGRCIWHFCNPIATRWFLLYLWNRAFGSFGLRNFAAPALFQGLAHGREPACAACMPPGSLTHWWIPKLLSEDLFKRIPICLKPLIALLDPTFVKLFGQHVLVLVEIQHMLQAMSILLLTHSDVVFEVDEEPSEPKMCLGWAALTCLWVK